MGSIPLPLLPVGSGPSEGSGRGGFPNAKNDDCMPICESGVPWGMRAAVSGEVGMLMKVSWGFPGDGCAICAEMGLFGAVVGPRRGIAGWGARRGKEEEAAAGWKLIKKY